MQRAINPQKNQRKNRKPITILQLNAPLESNRLFEVMFVYDDDEDSVEVVESPYIDFNRIIEQLDQGNSVFIAPKSKNTFTIDKEALKNDEKIFVTHI